MPITTRGIWTPDDNDDWDLTVDWAANAASTDAAINAVASKTTFWTGTEAQRLLLNTTTSVPKLQAGLVWESIDTGVTRRYTGTAWTLYNSVICLGRAEVGGGSNQNFSSGTFGVISGLSVPVNLGSAQTLRIYANITTYASTTDSVLAIQLRDGATTLAEGTFTPNSSNALVGTAARTALIFEVPGANAGSHTYTLWGARTAGSGTVTVVKDTATNALQLSVDRIG